MTMCCKRNPPEIGLTSNHFPMIGGRASARASKRASGQANEQAEGQKAQPQLKAILHNHMLTTCRGNMLKLGHHITHFPAILRAS